MCRACPGIKKQGKIPKRIHKAERERRKREQFNELFLELAGVLGNFSFIYANFTIILFLSAVHLTLIISFSFWCNFFYDGGSF